MDGRYVKSQIIGLVVLYQIRRRLKKDDQGDIMKLAIMQPYLFPYVGYYQLITAVDTFVIYDDINYIKGGWINRNRILLNAKASLFSLQLVHKSPNKLINEIKIVPEGNNRGKILAMVSLAYKRAPMYDNIFPLIKEILMNNESNLSEYLYFSLLKVTNYLGLSTKLIKSSGISKTFTLRAESKILDICSRLNSSTYINAIGGMTLYNKGNFLANKIKLKFIKMKDIKYKQYGNNFVPNLSIIDLMMFGSKLEIRKILKEYSLI